MKLLHDEVTKPEAAGVILCSLVIPIFVMWRAGLFWSTSSTFFDNPSYLQISEVILHRGGLTTGPHFWGFPAMISALRWGLGLNGISALVITSLSASLVAGVLIYRLYNYRVAVAMFTLCPTWLSLCVLGGSEPPFLCLLLISWLAFRLDRAVIAVIVASVATTVRPVGVFALISFGLLMMIRRDWRRLTFSVLIAIAIGLMYFGSVWAVSGNPFLNFKRYSPDWRSGSPVSLPFLELSRSTLYLLHTEPWTVSALTFLGFAVLGLGVVALFRKGHPRTTVEGQAEFLFAVLYLSFLLCYKYQEVAKFMPRFSIPALPFLLAAADGWLPHRRVAVWPLAVLCGLLTVAGAMTF